MPASTPLALETTTCPRKVSEIRRQRNVQRYNDPSLNGNDLTAVLADPDTPLPPPDHVPKPSRDSALTAFAQLAAIRLGTSRSLISLIDGHRQYILAEATPNLSLSDGHRVDGADRLWLGNCTIPRSRSVCSLVISTNNNTTTTEAGTDREDHKSFVIIDDLMQDERFLHQSFVHEGPRIRFFAGVPLSCSDGSNIGVLSVFGDTPRQGLGRGDLKILQSLSHTILNHLKHSLNTQEIQRGERMIRGLTSFVEGASVLNPMDSQFQSPKLASAQLSVDTDQNNIDGTKLQVSAGQTPSLGPSTLIVSSTSGSNTPHASDQRNKSPGPQEKLLPTGSKSMFARAANILRESSNLDGVILFDASVIANRTRTNASGVLSGQNLDENTSSQASESESSGLENPFVQDSLPSHIGTQRNSTDWLSSSIKAHRKRCHVLSFADRYESSVIGSFPDTNKYSLTEADLKKILESYPKGGIINFDESGSASSTEDSDSNPSATSVEPRTPAIPRSVKKRTIAQAIQSIAPGSRSVSLLPLWSYEKERWFAVCIGWTMDGYRSLSPALDLIYQKAFGNSIMTELARLDAMNTINTKATFVQSISHELRSPLHGILGGIQFMQNTPLSAFQASMLSSVEMSSRTLLDTVDHILDYSKVNDLAASKLQSHGKPHPKYRKRNRPSAQRNNYQDMRSNLPGTGMDIALSTEEVVEAVFAGSSYRTMSSTLDEAIPKLALSPGATDESGPLLEQEVGEARKNVRIVLDIHQRSNWTFRVLPGAWRRIVMNVFGNSVKFTESGIINVSLMAEDVSKLLSATEVDDSAETSSTDSSYQQESKLKLVISDTGIGMTDEFLSNHIFKPFYQENTFFAGTGLGMSIVQQLVESMDGNIRIKSKLHVGTEVQIEIPIYPSSNPSDSMDRLDLQSIADVTARVSHLKVCVLERVNTNTTSIGEQSHVSFGFSLAEMLREWFSADAYVRTEWQDHDAEMVICTEPDFETLEKMRSKTRLDKKAPIFVFVALDGIEASALRNDARVLSKESVVEIITQPCGPFKISKVLGYCLERQTSRSYESDRQRAIDIPMARTPSTVTPSPTMVKTQFIENPNNPRILVVDDNHINRRLLVAFMNKNRFDYVEAVNGLEAVEAVQNARRPFDAILMDLSMPVMDGITAIRKIRRFEETQGKKAVRIIALTGLASTSARVEAMSSGANKFLTKPVQFRELFALLEVNEKEDS